jgi:cardiolipin synthase
LSQAGQLAGVELLQGGLEFFPALEQAFDAAREQILMETYIFDFTGSGAGVGEALIRAARRGVRVWLVVDGVGTGHFAGDWRARFDAAGVQWQIYSPLGTLGLLLPSRWRRLHRKLCVVDGHTGFCGGINVLDDYYDPNYGPLDAPRLDFAVRLSGPQAAGLVAQMAEVMTQFWWRIQAGTAVRRRAFGEAMATVRNAGQRLVRNPLAEGRGPASGGAHASLLFRDNLRNRTRIERAYRKAISAAQHDIVIANAYFLPGRKLRRALIHAAGRGVKVQLLLQGRYEYFMQYHASRPIYHALLAAGIEIHEYAPSFLHAKVAVIDAHAARPWATVGSSNLDPLSLLLAREANVVVQGSAFAIDLHQRLAHAMAHEGRRMDPQAFANRPWHARARDWVAFGLMRWALWVAGKRY